MLRHRIRDIESGTGNYLNRQRCPATMPDDLSLIPGTHMLEGKTNLLLSSDLHIYTMVCVSMPPKTHQM